MSGTDNAHGTALIDCGMCGHAFTRQEGAACQSGCPVSKGCGLVTCPSCGHEFPPESKLVNLVRSLVRKIAPKSSVPASGDT